MLRDDLAENRTDLANERTFLAYLRTALTFFVAGASFIKFFDSLFLKLVGWIFIPIGIVTAFMGFLRFKRYENEINEEVNNNHKK